MIESKFQLMLDKLGESLMATGAKYGGFSCRPPRGSETPHFIEDGHGFYIELNFLPDATEQDRTALIDVWLTFDYTEIRELKPKSAIRQAVQALSATQRNQLLTELLVDLLENQPQYAKRLGINLEVDQAKPKQIKLK